MREYFVSMQVLLPDGSLSHTSGKAQGDQPMDAMASICSALIPDAKVTMIMMTELPPEEDPSGLVDLDHQPLDPPTNRIIRLN